MEEQLEEFLKGKIDGFRIEGYSIVLAKSKIVICKSGNSKHYTIHLGGASGFADLHSKRELTREHKTLIRVPRRQLFRFLIRLKHEPAQEMLKQCQLLEPSVVAAGPFTISRLDNNSPIAKEPILQRKKTRLGFDFEKLTALGKNEQIINQQLVSCKEFVAQSIPKGEVLNPSSFEPCGALQRLEFEDQPRYLFIPSVAMNAATFKSLEIVGEMVGKYSKIPVGVWVRFLSRSRSPIVPRLIEAIQAADFAN